VVTGRDDSLYVFSGASLFKKEDGTVGRIFLNDAHSYSEKSGWNTLASSPLPLTAASALPWGQSHILVSSGDDGSNFDQNEVLGDSHPGFSKAVWAYHTITDTWVEKGQVPAPYVTTQAVSWQGGMVIPGGEDRPGHRGAMVLSGRPLGTAKGLNLVDYGTLGLYFGTLVLMGLYFTRREQSMEVFFLGGRKVPWWAVGLSIFGTSLSSITFLAIPANAFSSNWVAILSNLGIVLVAPIVVYYYIPRYREKPIPTAYAYLEQRFNLAARMYGSFVFILFQLGRMAIILYLPSIALSAATGMSITWSVLSMGAMTTFYTMLGGIEAVIWTDVVQSVILLVGAGLALFLVMYNIDGGVGAAFSMAMDHEKFHTFNWSWDMTTTAVWVCVIGNFFSMLYPYTADQTMVQRYLSTADVKDARRAVWTNAWMTIPVSLIFFSLGTGLWAFFKHRPELLDPNLKNDAILPLFFMVQFPAGLKGVIIAGIFAAAMSSLDSSINSLASVLVGDYYRRFKKNATEEGSLQVARVVTVILGCFGTGAALYLAGKETTSLFNDYLQLLGLAGGALAGLVALGMFTQRAHGWGALAGAVTSSILVTWVWLNTEVHFFLYGAIGFVTSYVLGYCFSVLLPVRGDEVEIPEGALPESE
jgi:SSS family transporter